MAYSVTLEPKKIQSVLNGKDKRLQHPCQVSCPKDNKEEHGEGRRGVGVDKKEEAVIRSLKTVC